MANPEFSALFRVYPCKNPELSMISRQCYEFGKTIAKEPSSALSSGLDEHAIRRQKDYIGRMRGFVDALHAKPIPDLPAVHPTGFSANLSKPYETFVEDISGELVALNEQTQLLAQYWMICAVELIASQSSALAGSLAEFDYQRAINNLGVLEKFLEEMAKAPPVDLPETANPGAELSMPASKK